jgi:hypothetical protein
MIRAVFIYTTKIWLSAVAVSSIIMGSICMIFILNIDRSALDIIQHILLSYFMLLVIQLIASVIPWLIFNWVVIRIIQYDIIKYHQKVFILISGIVLTIITFFAFSLAPSDDSLLSNDIIIAAMCCNCICIGLSIQFYNLPTQISKNNSND